VGWDFPPVEEKTSSALGAYSGMGGGEARSRGGRGGLRRRTAGDRESAPQRAQASKGVAALHGGVLTLTREPVKPSDPARFFRFQVVEGLLTNFHLPRSSTAAAGGALLGRQRLWISMRKDHGGYRFFSMAMRCGDRPSPPCGRGKNPLQRQRKRLRSDQKKAPTEAEAIKTGLKTNA